MTTANPEKKTKKTAVAKITPFGKTETTRPPELIVQETFGIGIRDYDRGADVWDANRVDEQGKPAPGWVHVPNLSLECVVEFSANEGKGTGRQCIPVNEFVDYVGVLQGIHDSGYATVQTSDRTEYTPTNVVAKESFAMVRPKITQTNTDGTVTSTEDKTAAADIVSVRCTSGKGAKPMLVHRDSFPAVLGLLTQIAGNLEEYTEMAWDRYNAAVAAGEPTDPPADGEPASE